MSGAQIFTQGYSKYEGPRLGVQSAISAVYRESVRQVLGIGRSGRLKLVPAAIGALAYFPVVVFIGLAVLMQTLAPDLKSIVDDLLPSYGEFMSWIKFVAVLFAALCGSMLLARDRRTGMLGVYLASPLDRLTYILGKAWAAITLITGSILVPVLVLLLSWTIIGFGPDGPAEWGATFFKIVVSGLIIGLFYCLTALAISCFTDRASTAVVSFLALVYISGSVVSAINESNNNDGPHWVKLFNLYEVPSQLTLRIMGETGRGWFVSEVSTTSLTLTWLGVCVGSSLIIWAKYRRLTVRR